MEQIMLNPQAPECWINHRGEALIRAEQEAEMRNPNITLQPFCPCCHGYVPTPADTCVRLYLLRIRGDETDRKWVTPARLIEDPQAFDHWVAFRVMG